MAAITAQFRRLGFGNGSGPSAPIAVLGAIVGLITVLLFIEFVQDPETFFQALMKALGLGSVYAIIDYGVYLIRQEQAARLGKERLARAPG